MGTRGRVTLVSNGVKKTWYVHFDADSLGWMLLRDLKLLLRAVGGKMEIIKMMVDNLKQIETGTPTEEEVKLFFEYSDTRVERQSLDSWYCLLRKCQNSLINTLMTGYYVEDRETSHVQFHWVLDFDANEFYYDDCPHFPLDKVPHDWGEQCNEFIDRQWEKKTDTTSEVKEQ